MIQVIIDLKWPGKPPGEEGRQKLRRVLQGPTLGPQHHLLHHGAQAGPVLPPHTPPHSGTTSEEGRGCEYRGEVVPMPSPTGTPKLFIGRLLYFQ